MSWGSGDGKELWESGGRGATGVGLLKEFQLGVAVVDHELDAGWALGVLVPWKAVWWSVVVEEWIASRAEGCRHVVHPTSRVGTDDKF